MRVVADIEANELLERATRVWCLVAKDIDTGEEYYFHPPLDNPDNQDHCSQILSGNSTQKDFEYYHQIREFAKKVTLWVGHNFLSYDAPVLNKLVGTDIKLPDQIVDTLILSRLFNPERSGHAKPHSLEAWGNRLGAKKSEFTDFSQFSPSMLEYCVQDLRVTHKLFFHLLEEGKEFSKTSSRLEHHFRHIINQQEQRGWLVDRDRLEKLYVETGQRLLELEKPLKELFPPKVRPIKSPDMDEHFCRKIKINKDGSISKRNLGHFGDDWPLVWGDFGMFEWTEFNPASVPQIKERLFDLGWEPKEFKKPTRTQLEKVLSLTGLPKEKWYSRNKAGFSDFSSQARDAIWNYEKEHGKVKGSPLVDEDTMEDFAQISGKPEVKLLAEYLLVNSRHSMAKSWLDHIAEDGRLHGEVNTLGAVTGRTTSRNPNLQNISAVRFDKEGKPLFGVEGKYGADCRASFIAQPGYVLFGTDAPSLELRMMCHYMDDPEYTEIAINGTKEAGNDVHTINMRLAGLPDRDTSKTFFYGFVYGAGDEKIGKIVGGTKHRGEILRKTFLDNLPKLKQLIEETQLEASRGFIWGLDGRKVWVRRKNAALNTKLQSAGAIVCKTWLVYMQKEIDKRGLRAYLVGSIHDEYQFEVHPDDVEQMGEVSRLAMCMTRNKLNVKVPLDADGMWRAGKTWVDTH